MTKRLVLLLGCCGLVFLAGCLGPCLPPIASFTACPDGSRGGLEMQFSSTSQGGDGHWIVFFEWDFGDGSKLNDYYGWVSHAYADVGSYKVTLRVTDDRGIKASTEQIVVVGPVAEVHNVALLPSFPPSAVAEVVNLSELFLYSVSVKVKFYDADGVRIGEAFVDVLSIDPGERVRFVAQAPEGLGPASSAGAWVQSFAAECSKDVPVYPPIPVDEER